MATSKITERQPMFPDFNHPISEQAGSRTTTLEQDAFVIVDMQGSNSAVYINDRQIMNAYSGRAIFSSNLKKGTKVQVVQGSYVGLFIYPLNS